MDTNGKSNLVDTVRVKSIRANIFEADGKYGRYFEVKLSRTYMKDGDVAFSSSFRTSDLPLVEHAVRHALDRALALEAADHADSKDSPAESISPSCETDESPL